VRTNIAIVIAILAAVGPVRAQTADDDDNYIWVKSTIRGKTSLYKIVRGPQPPEPPMTEAAVGAMTVGRPRLTHPVLRAR